MNIFVDAWHGNPLAIALLTTALLEFMFALLFRRLVRAVETIAKAAQERRR